MTKILYWDIDKFALEKITRPSEGGDGLWDWAAMAATDRFAYILGHIGQCDPDIFVIVDVGAESRSIGKLATGEGYEGLQTLLEKLKKKDSSALWSLVPPLITGQNETVGVFYKALNVQFTGPNLWAGGNGPTSADRKKGAEYPDDYQTLAEAKIAVAARYNPGVSQSLCAAKVAFKGKAKAGGKPAPPIKFARTARAPHLTTFWDLKGQRDIRMFSIHGPAKTSALAYMQKLATVPDIIETDAQTQISIVIGNFNLDLLSPENTYSKKYDALLNVKSAGYALGLRPPNDQAVKKRGYYATHIRPTDTARCSQDSSGDNVTYPTYGYATDTEDAIDNVFHAGVDEAKLTVINAVVGSPYDLYPELDPNAPKGSATFTSTIAWPNMGGATSSPAPPENAYVQTLWAGADTWFREERNYRKASETSEHLPLLIEF